MPLETYGALLVFLIEPIICIIETNNTGANILNISLRFFALYKERAGPPNATIIMPVGATVADLIHRMHDMYPSLPRNITILIAVNYQYVEPDTLLHDRDEVAIIPPVTGG